MVSPCIRPSVRHWSRTIPRCGRTHARETGTFAVAHYRLPAGYEMDAHSHARAGVAVVLEGRLSLRLGGTRLAADPGELLVLPAGAEHRERASHGARCLLVQLEGAEPLEGLARAALEPGAARSEEALGAARRLARALIRPGSEEVGLEADAIELFLSLQMKTESRVWRRSARFEARGRPRAPWLNRVTEALRDRWREPPRLSELARDAGVTPEHLARTFRSTIGCSVGDYLRRQRLLHTARRLRESTGTLSRIAYWAGYADQSHMTRQFRSYLGVTPGQYRLRS